MREQAALSASEITADMVNNFVADLEDESDYEQTFSSSPTKERKSKWEKILMNMEESSSTKRKLEDLLHVQNLVGISKINGKHNKSIQEMNLMINGSSVVRDGFAEFIHANVHAYKEVLPGLESWKASTIASWHNVEGHAIQWFCVVCIDQKGMLPSPYTIIVVVL